MHEFWELVAFVANVIIFIVVGVVIAQNANPQAWFCNSWSSLCCHTCCEHIMGVFYPLMKKAGYGLPTKDAIVVWWGALRGAIGLALALVVYSEHLRYDFAVENGGEGYKQGTTSVFVLDKGQAVKLDGNKNINYYQGVSLALASAEISGGKVVGISQVTDRAYKNLGSKTSQEASQIRQELSNGEKVVVIVGEGEGAVAQASLIGISTGA